jgi:hypothetical protein
MKAAAALCAECPQVAAHMHAMHKTTCDVVMLMGLRARRGRGDSTPFYAPIDLSGAMCLPPTCGAASHDAIQVPDAPARRAHLLLDVVVVSTRLTICVLIHILFRGVPLPLRCTTRNYFCDHVRHSCTTHYARLARDRRTSHRRSLAPAGPWCLHAITG